MVPWARLAEFAFAIIRLNLLVTVVMAPFITVLVMVAQPLAAVPLLILTAWLASPGLAATFAAMRDCWALDYHHDTPRTAGHGDEQSPQVRTGAHHTSGGLVRGGRAVGGHDAPSRAERTAVARGVIAAPWWSASEASAVWRPFWRTARRLAGRSLAVSAAPMALALVALVDAVWATRHPWGQYLTATFLLVGVWSLLTWPVVLVCVTEFPQARWWACWRTAAVASLRRWYLSLVSGVVLAALLVGTYLRPTLTPFLASALLLYVVWANSRWMVAPVREALVTEAAGTPSPTSVEASTGPTSVEGSTGPTPPGIMESAYIGEASPSSRHRPA